LPEFSKLTDSKCYVEETIKYEPNNPIQSIKCHNKLKQKTVLQCFQSAEHLTSNPPLIYSIKSLKRLEHGFYVFLQNSQEQPTKDLCSCFEMQLV